MFVPFKLFKPHLMFAGKAGDYPNETPFSCSTLGQAPDLTPNISLGWKSLQGKHTLAYYENS
jgi:hypothetical protein